MFVLICLYENLNECLKESIKLQKFSANLAIIEKASHCTMFEFHKGKGKEITKALQDRLKLNTKLKTGVEFFKTARCTQTGNHRR